jgi:hypothetical protein
MQLLLLFFCCRLPLGPGRVNLLYLVDSTLKQASKVPASQQSQHVSGGCVLFSLSGVSSNANSLGGVPEELRRSCLLLICKQRRFVYAAAPLKQTTHLFRLPSASHCVCG